MFETGRFASKCRAALAADRSDRAVRQVVARAVANPAALLRALGEPCRARVQPLHRGPELTIPNLVRGPRRSIMPHNHRKWAVVGLDTGCEDIIVWRRIPGDPAGRPEAAGAQAPRPRDCVPLGRDLIHSVTNPIPRFTGAIHVHGGEVFAAERSEGAPETLQEGRYDLARAMQRSEDCNNRLAR